MSVFEVLDTSRLRVRILAARRRVLLCAPGFADEVGSALIQICQRLGRDAVTVIVDGTDHAARLGYGHFDALRMLSDAGVPVRLEPGLRLGVVIVDDAGWCLAMPPLLVDETMEETFVPNAMVLTASQVNVIVDALTPPIAGAPEATASLPELGQAAATPEQIAQTDEALRRDPPQRFDVSRKVQVFNAYVEFVELELLGTQVGRQRIPIPPYLLLAVSDDDTRRRLTATFQVLEENSDLRRRADALRRAVTTVRQNYTRTLPGFGNIVLRANKGQLEQAVERLRGELLRFQSMVRRQLQGEFTRSREQLMQSLLPALERAPPEELSASIPGGQPTGEQTRQWAEAKLKKAFPDVEKLVRGMRLTLIFKAVTYKTLTQPEFQKAVRQAYPLVDSKAPFREFTAAAGE